MTAAAKAHELDVREPHCRTIRRDGRWHVVCWQPLAGTDEVDVFDSASATEALEYADQFVAFGESTGEASKH